MIEHVKKVLADPKQVMPDYDPAQGYEIAGFAWLQGWNDAVDGQTYPRRGQPDGYAMYSELLADFIRDVRKDLGTPKMPFVIGVMGVGGLRDPSPATADFRKAMAAPADMPEFKGNVTAVQTAPFWPDELTDIEAKRVRVGQMRQALDSKHKDHANADGTMTDEQKNEFMKKFEADLISPAEAATWKRGVSNAGYHYLGCAKIFALMGKHFAEANLALLEAGHESASTTDKTPSTVVKLGGGTPQWPEQPPANWVTFHLAHPGPGRAEPGDPNCIFDLKGKVHLHYIYRTPAGPAFAHVSSDDMVHWKWHDTVLAPPTTGHGMFSGTGFLTREGRPAIIYHAWGKGRNVVHYPADDTLEMEVTFKAPAAKEFGLDVLCDKNGANGLRVVYAADTKTLKVGAAAAPFALAPGEDLVLRIFIDRNLVEVFANDRQSVVAANPLVAGNLDVSLFSQGGDVVAKSVKGWKMKSIYPKS